MSGPTHITAATSVYTTTGNALFETASGIATQDVVIVDADAYLIAAGSGLNAGDAIGLLSLTTPWSVTVSGEAYSQAGHGISLVGTAIALSSTVLVGSEGEAHGGMNGIYCEHSANITNKGLVSSDTGFAVYDWGAINASVNNSGTVSSAHSGGILLNASGTSTITNSGTIRPASGSLAISTSTGADKVTNSGMIFGNVALAEGNDSFKNTGTGRINGNIDLGDGNDTFVGGAALPIGGYDIIGGAGNDLIQLGNTYYTYRATVGDGNDTVSGPGFYSASTDTGGVRINLDTIAHVDSNLSVTVAANSATGATIGSDRLIGMSKVEAGAGNDVIFGNAAANSIIDDGGSDHVFGLGGADSILLYGNGISTADGGSGNDQIDFNGIAPTDRATLIGGSGNDQLQHGNNVGEADFIGGAGRDTSVSGLGASDVFIYTKASDSGITRATRDVIHYFSGAGGDGDIIDLSAMDANTATAALDHFQAADFLARGAFTGHAGQLRYTDFTGGAILYADLNGDRKADFSIEVGLTSGHDLHLADFKLA